MSATLARIRREPLWIAAGVALLLAWIVLSRQMVIDDSFITYRFARNISAGYGPVWNPGGERTEGFTSVLHVLICAGGFKLGLDPLQLTRVLSILSLLLCAGMARDLFLRLSRAESRLGPWLWILLLGNALLVNAALFGLETMLFSLLITAAAWSWVRWFQGRTFGWLILFVTSSLLSVTCRPEGVIWVGGLLCGTALMQLVVARRELRSRPMVAAFAAAVLVIVVAAAFMYAKYLYFGGHLPNPYYIKAGSLLPTKGVLYVGAFVVWSLPLWLGLMWGTFRVREPVYAGLAGACLLVAMYYLHVLPIMGTSFRFLQPLWPVLCVCGLIGLDNMVLPSPKAGRIAGVFLALWAVAWTGASLLQIRHSNYHIRLLDAYDHVASACRDAAISPVPTIATEDQGIFPYRSQWKAIDFVGLVTNQVAWAHGSDQVIDFILKEHPEVICMRRWINTPPGRTKFFVDAARFEDQNERFEAHPLFSERYIEVGGFPAYSDDPARQLISFYVDRQSPQAQAIAQALRQGLSRVPGAVISG